jgi:hypothetical protein
MRYVHETLSKPTMEEEATAQGIAYGVLNKIGIPSQGHETWKSPLDYPRTYLDDGIGAYTRTEIGPPTPQETQELETILSSTNPFCSVYSKEYNLVK